MESVIHLTTMAHKQRGELVRILKQGGHNTEALCLLTDNELHRQWLAECEYIPTNQAPIPISKD